MRDVLAGEPAESVHAVVTDPPYHLTSAVKRFGGANAAPAQFGTDGAFARASRGFMGKTWDGGDLAFRSETWAEVWRVLKPGGHMLVFGGTRTFHRMAVAIEDAGFEIRDTLMWLYGTGFPKSHNLDGAWQGWGTALKPAWEPIILARKPLAGTVAENVLAHGAGAINVDGCRVPAPGGSPSAALRQAAAARGKAPTRPGEQTHTITNRTSFDTFTTARAGEALGRFPANVLHDGSDEVEAAFAAYGERGAAAPVKGTEPSSAIRDVLNPRARVPGAFHGDSGSAARFFYSAKATAADRAGSKHPTVKPVALMRYLVRLITPPGGTVLDPFAGSGTTGTAAIAEGALPFLIEREAEYAADIRRRFGMQPAAEDLFL